MRRSDAHAAQLPGRTRPLELCHAEPAGCARCLQVIASFLAEEMGHDLAAALDRPAEAYRAEMGADRCTLDQARRLRALTVVECLRREHERIGIPIVSISSVLVDDEVLYAEGRTR